MKKNGKAKKFDLPKPSPEGQQTPPQEEATEEIKRVVGFRDEYGLTVQQRSFCDLYIQSEDHNGSKCYMEAYPNVTDPDVAKAAASRLLTYVSLQNYLVSRTEYICEHVELSQEWCFRNIKLIAERCLQLEEIRNAEGEVVRVAFDPHGAAVATNMMMKNLGLYAADKTHKLEMNVNGKNIATVIAVPAFADDVESVSARELGDNGNGQQ